MTATISTTPTTTPSIPTALPDVPPAARTPRRRRLMSLAAVAALAAAGATFGVVAATGDSTPAPVEIVQDGRWGGPDVYEHGRPTFGGATTDGQRFGSADAAEAWMLP